MENLLIIFVKNPVLGKVKSRLAKTIGNEKALEVYKRLLKKTRNTTIDLHLDKCIYYSEKIEHSDLWEGTHFQKALQQGDDLGARMFNAIKTELDKSYKKVCLIGSDIMELTAGVIEKGFQLLDDTDVVVGPSPDGGYYLIGMKSPLPQVFENKSWGTNTVLGDTIKDFENMSLAYALLPELNDIDVLEDIRESDRTYLLS